MKIAQEAFL